MNKSIFVVIMILSFLNVIGQDFNPRVLVLSENATAQDFSFLKEELKDVQVVMLGENTHSDGNVFEMKTEIVKYLHKEMGFNTVAFESGVYDVWKAQKAIDNGEKTNTALEKSLFPIWSKAKEFEGFIDFFDQNKAMLKIFGFDNQITGRYGENDLIKDLFSYCKQNQISLKLKEDDLELLMESISNSGVFDEEDISYANYKTALTSLLRSIDKKPNEEIHFYWRQIIKSLLAIGEDSHIKKEPLLSAFTTTFEDNIRDKQMADNLLEYLKNHPDEKVICWGANAHFTNDMSSIKTVVAKDFVPMGAYIKKELKEKVYSLAAITATDSVYLNKLWHSTPIEKGSFEQFLKEKKRKFLFISSKQDEMKKNKRNRLFSPIAFIEAQLDLLHDGYLYFDEVKPSTMIDDNDVKIVSERKDGFLNADADKENRLDETFYLNEEGQLLEEVLIVNYSKKFTYSIISKAIENIDRNYPTVPFSSQQYSNVDVRVKKETVANLDFMNHQFDRSYNQIDRNTKQLKEVRWNVKGDYEPRNIREYWSLSYNNPIMYGRFLNARKSKKFVYRISEIKVYDNKKVYVIDFSIPRKHFTYTQRNIPSDYSGTLYINKDDFAIVKVIENWEYVENPESSKYDTYGWIEKYTEKEVSLETVQSKFEKINGLYFLTSSEIELSGRLLDKEKNTYPLKIFLESNWTNFNTANPAKISYKEEQNLFEKVEFDKVFWESYVLPQ